MAVEKVEICAGCGLIHKHESKHFVCKSCGSEVSVVVSKDIFLEMVKQGLAKQ